VIEYSNLPIMEERKKQWYAHNQLQSSKPPIIMEWYTFAGDIMPAMKCESESAKAIEGQLVSHIMNHELIDDDKVVPSFFPIHWQMSNTRLGIEFSMQHAKDSSGRELGYHVDSPINDITKDLNLLKHSQFSVDREGTYAWKAFVDETIGDILPTRIKNNSLEWFFCLTATTVYLMSMENMFIAMLDHPEEFHQMMSFITEDSLDFVKWQEEENLLVLNNDNDYVGSGSYGFINELPSSDTYAKTGKVTAKDLWCNFNSQESVGLSPSMYAEFFFPYYRKVAEHFGLMYYGCCEPVHEIWDNCLSELTNLRKVSVSAWCDEEFIGDRLRGGKTIYSRKPSPNYIGVGAILDEKAFAEHISKTLQAAKGCPLEFIFRDIYILNGDQSKPARAIKIVREQIEKMRG
jgi:hypothetical protein